MRLCTTFWECQESHPGRAHPASPNPGAEVATHPGGHGGVDRSVDQGGQSGVDDVVGVDARDPVELVDRAGLSELVDTERHLS